MTKTQDDKLFPKRLMFQFKKKPCFRHITGIHYNNMHSKIAAQLQLKEKKKFFLPTIALT